MSYGGMKHFSQSAARAQLVSGLIPGREFVLLPISEGCCVAPTGQSLHRFLMWRREHKLLHRLDGLPKTECPERKAICFAQLNAEIFRRLRQKLSTITSERGRRDRKPWTPERAVHSKALPYETSPVGGMRGGLQGSVPLPTAVGLAGLARVRNNVGLGLTTVFETISRWSP